MSDSERGDWAVLGGLDGDDGEITADHIIDDNTGDVTIYADAEKGEWVAADECDALMADENR